MKRLPALLALVSVIASISTAQAVRLDPGGRGQALIFPYYTVNAQQQTLLALTNPTSTAQVLKLRFREGYNGRSVLDLNVWLSPYDVWTGTIFALEDASVPGNVAGLFTTDRSCISPLLSSTGLTFGSNNMPYARFSEADFSGANADDGPSDSTRTREGWIEVIAMADLSAPLSVAVTHSAAGVPLNCGAVQLVDPSHASLLPPGGQLFGTASIINTGQGTIMATRAEALVNFTSVQLFAAPGSSLPNLSSVNDGVPGQPVTAQVYDRNGRLRTLTYGAPAADGVPATRPIDAVSALLMADRVINEYTINPGIGAGSDWVMTFPTKPFYTDPRLVGATPLSPFSTLFNAPGRARMELDTYAYDRQGRQGMPSLFCAPIQFCDEPALDYAVNVLPFTANASGPTAVLGSRLAAHAPEPLFPLWYLRAAEGLAEVELPHGRLDSIERNQLRGLPVIGFWATNLVNNAVTAGVLSNYSAAVRHVMRVTCTGPDNFNDCD